MKRCDAISARQLGALIFVALLSPLVRRFPRALAAIAGRSAWLSLPLAAAGLVLLWLLVRRIAARPWARGGLGAVFEAALGARGAQVLCGVYALWLSLYAGFLLRSGADRFITTVYHGAPLAVFVLTMLALSLPAALGRFRAVARCAMIYRALMVVILLLAVLLPLGKADFRLLLPVTAADALPIARAAGELLGALGVAVYLGFLGEALPRNGGGRASLRALGLLLALLLLITVQCIAMFGAELTAQMSYPFFMLVRDIGSFGSVERVEPAVVALWVCSDFVMLALLLHLGALALQRSFGARRGWPVLCALIAGAAAFLCARDLGAFRLLSETIIPAANAVFAFALPLLAAALAALRRRKQD